MISTIAAYNLTFLFTRQHGHCRALLVSSPFSRTLLHYSDKMQEPVRVQVPKGFDLSAAVCSYGWALLHPNRWMPVSASAEQ